MESEQIMTTTDGVRIPYRLDGSAEPNAPLIVLSNPSLVDWTVWDEFVRLFLADPMNKKYRILRYNNRGRSKHSNNKPLSVGILTDDMVALLDALKVSKAAMVAGMSLGAITALDLALKRPDRVARIMPCDLFPVSPPENRERWTARVIIAQKDPKAPIGSEGERLVGEEIAKIMVQGWLSPKTFDGGSREERVPQLKKLVHDNRLDGLINIVDAISSYNLLDGVEKAIVPALFVAGEADKPVQPGMKKLAESYGVKGAELHVVADAGHLPGWEQPAEVVRLLSSFLNSAENKPT